MSGSDPGPAASRHSGSAAASHGVAAFDFDGTLVPNDSFLGFLREVAGPSRLALAWARSTGQLARAGRDPLWRDALKATLVRATLAGRDAAELERAGLAYAPTLVRRVPEHMRSVLDWHRRQGRRIVVVSASLDVYLQPAGQLLGADGVLATRLEVGDDGRITGRLLGSNCRGPEKARRLARWMDQAGLGAATPVWAYGDSAGDREMLAAAAFAVQVRRTRLPRGHPAPAAHTPGPGQSGAQRRAMRRPWVQVRPRNRW